MDPPKSPTKPDPHPILARRFFDKLENQSMRASSVADRPATLDSRERQITRDRRDNEAAAADFLRRERSVVEVERRLEKRETEMDGRPTREEVELLEAELAEAKGEAAKSKHKFQSTVDEHNYLAKKYHNFKHEHEKTKRDFGSEIVRLGKVAKDLQSRPSDTKRKLEDLRLENSELKMHNAELETRNEFLEKEYRCRLSGFGSEEKEKEKKEHRRRPSRIPIATKEKKTDEHIPVSHFAKSTVASRARAVSSSPPAATEKKEAPIATGNQQDQVTTSKPSGPRTMPLAVSVGSNSESPPDSEVNSFTSLPPPAYGAFAEPSKPISEPPVRSPSSNNREAMMQGYYSAADLLARGPPVPPHAQAPTTTIPPPPIVEANTARKIASSNTRSNAKARPVSYVPSNDDDDVVYPHSAAVEGPGAKKHVKKKYSQDFQDAVKRSLPWLKKETQKIYSEAFL